MQDLRRFAEAQNIGGRIHRWEVAARDFGGGTGPWLKNYGHGSKLSHQGTAGFAPCLHLPGFRLWVPSFDPQPCTWMFGQFSKWLATWVEQG